MEEDNTTSYRFLVNVDHDDFKYKAKVWMSKHQFHELVNTIAKMPDQPNHD